VLLSLRKKNLTQQISKLRVFLKCVNTKGKCS
jgi:hypothetical protein